MRQGYIDWYHTTNVVVVDAEQSVGALLSVMKHYRTEWVVLCLSKKKNFYAFKRVELERALRNKKSNKSVYKVLRLREEDASRAVLPGKRGYPSDIALLDYKYVFKKVGLGRVASAYRFVWLDKLGRVKGVGEPTPDIKRALQPPAYGSDAGAMAMAAPGAGLWRELQKERVVRAFALVRPGARHLGRKSLPPQRQARGTRDAGVSREYNLVRIFYATDRVIKNTAADGNTVYANARSQGGQLIYGTSDISIPFSHKKGEMESPSIWKFWKFEIRENPKKHVVLLKTEQQKRDAFFREMRDKVDQSKAKSAFVFIHGYNVRFEDAAKRTAQLAFDLKFPGAPILYSWASKAAPKAYVADAETIDLTKHLLVKFLADVAKESGAKVVHLIAHSMGNRALVRALNEIASTLAAKNRPKFHQIVLTAPDINRHEFLLLVKGLRRMGRRVTLYGSSKDIPLYFSKRVNEYDRVGFFGQEIMIVKEIDTIDASSVETDFLAHTPIKSKTVLLDLFDLIWHGLPPDERPALVKKTIPSGDYWEFAK